ncbi:MAG: 3-deoxy-manno-octulosonate cytidylyltransferase [Deltaproteobacteria bacterium]|nr:3-deoxy-manno-octulosonate cytidylyltransferase [Deltaproteobacteria bacterium]
MGKKIAVIPARYASTRLPGKPLAKIAGRPMILHVVERSLSIPVLDDVVVATDDQRILQCVQDAGYKTVLTSKAHPSGTDRVAEAARLLGLAAEDIVVNIQGDQPFLHADAVRAMLELLSEDETLHMTTAACPMKLEDVGNPNKVKVVVDKRGRALYFSRAAIPFDRDGQAQVLCTLNRPDTAARLQGHGYLRHLGLYAFRMFFLQEFVRLGPGFLEQMECLEQLRAMENGYSIGVVRVADALLEIDTPEDLEAANRMMAHS